MDNQTATSLSQLIGVNAVVLLIVWGLLKLAMGQLAERVEERFKTIDIKLKTFDPLHGELARVDKDLVQVRLEMSQNYVRQDGLRYLADRLDAMSLKMENGFKEVFAKLDSKADKSECDRFHRGHGQ